jgi:proton-dependent oligopeptide transporter, POT family
MDVSIPAEWSGAEKPFPPAAQFACEAAKTLGMDAPQVCYIPGLHSSGGAMGFSTRLQEIREGFERPFWVANISELFERLSYYAAFASLARYLHEALNFPTERAADLTGLFGGLVWFLAIFGGAIADRLGFRRALSLAYLILATAYFLLGSIAAPWLGPLRNAMPLGVFVLLILMLPALGVALVKPCVVGTTARASKANVRSIGYSIYYTLVNIGGALGPIVASWVHQNLSVENVFRVAAASVFLMFFLVLLLFKEPRQAEGKQVTSIGETLMNFGKVLGNPKFMLFLLIFSGYWIVYWQEFITLPLYVHDYIDPKANTEKMLATGPIVVIALTVAISVLTKRVAAFRAVLLGTLISMVAFAILALHSTVWAAYAALVVVALGELTQQPRYYDYISRLAPANQQGTYMGFAFLPLGIGAFVAGRIGGKLLHHFGEVQQRPERFWWAITGIGVGTTVLLWIYDRVVRPSEQSMEQGT